MKKKYGERGQTPDRQQERLRRLRENKERGSEGKSKTSNGRARGRDEDDYDMYEGRSDKRARTQ
jgi:hypothetical protein